MYSNRTTGGDLLRVALSASFGLSLAFQAAFAVPLISPAYTFEIPGMMAPTETGSITPKSAFTTSARKLGRKILTPGVLEADIYEHLVPSVPPRKAWSVVTSGLKKAGQSEVMITILQELGDKEDDLPEDALLYLRLLPGLVKEGKFLKLGERTALSGRDFISPQFKGLLYVPAESYGGIDIEPGTLASVPLTAEELRVWELSGPARVMGRLVRAGRYYPYLTWCDRKRKSVFSASDVEFIAKSSISRSAHLLSFESGAWKEKEKCVLSLSKASGARLAADIARVPADAAIMLALGIPSGANAFIVWSPPGSSQIDAVGPAGSDATRLSGSFIELLPGLKENEMHIVEDGFALMLTRASWTELVDALKDGKPYRVALKGLDNPVFTLEWQP